MWQALIILADRKGDHHPHHACRCRRSRPTPRSSTGGVYFMISRVLGADFGGTIGLTLCTLSQAVSIAFYVIGFSEALFGLFAPPGFGRSGDPGGLQGRAGDQLDTGHRAAFRGHVQRRRCGHQGPVLHPRPCSLLSVVSFMVGGGDREFRWRHISPPIMGLVTDLPNDASAGGFWIVFAIFFPGGNRHHRGRQHVRATSRIPAHSIPKWHV